MADAADRTALGVAQKLSLAPAPQRCQLLTGEAGPFVKVRQGIALGVLVPGADQLAVVAAVNAVAYERPQFQRYRSGVFDGEVRNTAPRVQPVRRHDGLRRADRDAGAAAAAMPGHGLRGGQRQVDINLAQKKHGAGFAAEQQRVLAAPAQAAAGGQFGLEHGRRVGEGAVAKGAHVLGDAFAQLLQARAQHLVIVAAAGIHRDHGFGGPRQARQFIGLPVGRFGSRARCPGGQIVHARRDHAHRAGHQFGGAGPFEPVRRHVMHVAMKTGRQPGR